MTDNKNQVAEMGKLGFSLLSFKTKMIIIGIVIGIFLIIIVPVVAIMSIFTLAPKNSSQKKGGDKGSGSSSGTSVSISVNEVFDVGIMGSTGNSTGPHLHFEVRLNDNTSSNAVDPYPYLFGEEQKNE